jgi:hypothetical protein
MFMVSHNRRTFHERLVIRRHSEMRERFASKVSNAFSATAENESRSWIRAKRILAPYEEFSVPQIHLDSATLIEYKT